MELFGSPESPSPVRGWGLPESLFSTKIVGISVQNQNNVLESDKFLEKSMTTKTAKPNSLKSDLKSKSTTPYNQKIQEEECDGTEQWTVP